jgi:hypothetical protein
MLLFAVCAIITNRLEYPFRFYGKRKEKSKALPSRKSLWRIYASMNGTKKDGELA